LCDFVSISGGSLNPIEAKRAAKSLGAFVGALRGAVAMSPRKTVIHLTPKGSNSGGLRAFIDGEFPLGTLRSAIGETLATLPGQDDLVELDFIGDPRPPIRISRYRYQHCQG
jgi:hypothetical protein